MYILYLILIVIFIIYNITGIYLIIPLILAIANFIVTTINLVYDPKNMLSRLIQLISLAFIIFTIILNIKYLFGYTLYKSAYILPLSINKIDFFRDIVSKLNGIYVFTDYSYKILHFFDKFEISVFLKDTLEKDKVYIVSLELIKSYPDYEQGEPTMVLSDPILITTDSNPDLLSNFIYNKLSWACLLYKLEDDEFNKNKILLKYREISISNPIF